MSPLLIVLLGWLALCVPASIILLALGRAASVGDDQRRVPTALGPAGDVVELFGQRSVVCPACAVVVVAETAGGPCPRCGGETAKTQRVGARHVTHVA